MVQKKIESYEYNLMKCIMTKHAKDKLNEHCEIQRHVYPYKIAVMFH